MPVLTCRACRAQAKDEELEALRDSVRDLREWHGRLFASGGAPGGAGGAGTPSAYAALRTPGSRASPAALSERAGSAMAAC